MKLILSPLVRLDYGAPSSPVLHQMILQKGQVSHFAKNNVSYLQQVDFQLCSTITWQFHSAVRLCQTPHW